MQFAVYRNGKPLGIIETNLAWALVYWSSLPISRGRFTLRLLKN